MHPSCSQPEHTRSACAQRGFTATHPNLLSSKGFPLDLLSANPQCWGWRPGPCICLTSATTERCAPFLVAFDNPGSCPGQGRCLLYTVFDIRHRSPRWKAELEATGAPTTFFSLQRQGWVSMHLSPRSAGPRLAPHSLTQVHYPASAGLYAQCCVLGSPLPAVPRLLAASCRAGRGTGQHFLLAPAPDGREELCLETTSSFM